MKKLALLLLVLFGAGCAPTTERPPSLSPGAPATPTTMTITSPAFSEGRPIPSVYSCDGKSTTPPLQISEVPTGTKSLALIVEDPDTPRGIFVHWVMFNIDPSTAEIVEGQPPRGTDGSNGAGKTGYIGLCPPSGSHRYFFRLYALDTILSLSGGASKADLLRAADGHVLAETALMGTYQRR